MRQRLAEFVSASESGLQIPVKFVECKNANEFLSILDRLINEAKKNSEIPIVHVECHGSAEHGLEFENGSTLAWPEVASALLELNKACRFNLLAIFSACFGGYFLGQITAIEPAPCWGMIAPSETVDPGEILGGFRTFYASFRRHSDAGIAIAELAKMPLSHGRWFGQTAEGWFERLLIGYIQNHCTLQAARARATVLFRKAKKDGFGHTQSIGGFIRLLRKRNREDLLQQYFDTFFITAEIPENVERFKPTRARLESKLRDLRTSNKYVL